MEIYTDIPAPHKRGSYKWGNLNIGDSTKFNNPGKFHTIRNSLYNYTSRNPSVFTTRVIGDELWVWRIR